MKGTDRRPRLQLPKELRDWLASSEEQARRESYQRLKTNFPSAEEEDRLEQLSQPEQSSSQPEASPSEAAGQKHGGGREPILTAEEDAKVGALYWSNPPRRGKRTQATAFKDVREQLPKDKREISDSALRNCIRRHRPRP